MKNYLIITADTNDGDYVTSKNVISDEKLEKIKPVIQAIKDFKPYGGGIRTHHHNYTIGECCRTDLGEKSAKQLYGHLEGFNTFDNMCPYGEYGIHTIASVELLIVADEIKLL